LISQPEVVDIFRGRMEKADYDLDTAKAMLQTERYLYVGFMAHQAIEKALKAYQRESSIFSTSCSLSTSKRDILRIKKH
jgi:HEPN domain-containing protein